VLTKKLARGGHLAFAVLEAALLLIYFFAPGLLDGSVAWAFSGGVALFAKLDFLQQRHFGFDCMCSIFIHCLAVCVLRHSGGRKEKMELMRAMRKH
jgi:hypothetical protein